MLCPGWWGRGSTGNLISGARSTLNFGNILNNTSKALGVVKEAIPIVKEVGPMVGNMRQMLKIASIFKDETDTSPISTNQKSNTESIKTEENTITKNSDTTTSTTTRTNDYEPNFFL